MLTTNAKVRRGSNVVEVTTSELVPDDIVVCSDKTGTLTLNQMTARSLVIQNRKHAVSGEEYSFEGRVERHEHDESFTFTSAFNATASCSDAVVGVSDEGYPHPVGDPTETEEGGHECCDGHHRNRSDEGSIQMVLSGPAER